MRIRREKLFLNYNLLESTPTQRRKVIESQMSLIFLRSDGYQHEYFIAAAAFLGLKFCRRKDIAPSHFEFTQRIIKQFLHLRLIRHSVVHAAGVAFITLVGKLHLKRAHDVCVILISNRVFQVIALTSDVVPKSARRSLGFLGYDKSAVGKILLPIPTIESIVLGIKHVSLKDNSPLLLLCIAAKIFHIESYFVKCLKQWCSTGVPREMLLNIENSVFGEVAEVVVVVNSNCYEICLNLENVQLRVENLIKDFP
ncbi:hypothetical protein AGLY_016012 [Aphis glycines]|uniref:Uncharacterized protein n=1 Tax=Aphis glycines TaxID=307491 RepID=A0A6G0SYI4_APHGL|nr:hypothetical protein AGLY_016012 [Aphis glycines]